MNSLINHNLNRPTILVVDDSEVQRDMSKMILTKHGLEVQTLSDASLVIETINFQKPSLILLDIIMPEVSGNELLIKIRQQYNSVELPIIMVTSKTDASDVIESLKLGANDYIVKPVEFDIAIRRIMTHLEISFLSKKATELKEHETIQEMLKNYNHKLINPLAIATGFIELLQEQYGQEEKFKKLKMAMGRIGAIVKKTTSILEPGSVEFERYAALSKMLKIHEEDID